MHAGVKPPSVIRVDFFAKAPLKAGFRYIKEKLGGLGYERVGGTPEHFEVFIRKEVRKWADVVKRTGAKIA